VTYVKDEISTERLEIKEDHEKGYRRCYSKHIDHTRKEPGLSESSSE